MYGIPVLCSLTQRVIFTLEYEDHSALFAKDVAIYLPEETPSILPRVNGSHPFAISPLQQLQELPTRDALSTQPTSPLSEEDIDQVDELCHRARNKVPFVAIADGIVDRAHFEETSQAMNQLKDLFIAKASVAEFEKEFAKDIQASGWDWYRNQPNLDKFNFELFNRALRKLVLTLRNHQQVSPQHQNVYKEFKRSSTTLIVLKDIIGQSNSVVRRGIYKEDESSTEIFVAVKCLPAERGDLFRGELNILKAVKVSKVECRSTLFAATSGCSWSSFYIGPHR